MSEQPIIRVECVDSCGSKGSALELSKVAWWPTDPLRWSYVWFVDSDSPRCRTVLTDDQLRAFAVACLNALERSSAPVPPLAPAGEGDPAVAGRLIPIVTPPHDPETLRYRVDVSLVTDSKNATARIESRIDGPDQWHLYGPGTDDPFDGVVIAEGASIGPIHGLTEALTAFAVWQP